MEVAQNRGLTLCPIDSLFDSAQYLIIHTPKERLICWFCPEKCPGTLAPSLAKVNLENDPLIMILITVFGGRGDKWALSKICSKDVDLGWGVFGEFCTAVVQMERGQPSAKEKEFMLQPKTEGLNNHMSV